MISSQIQRLLGVCRLAGVCIDQAKSVPKLCQGTALQNGIRTFVPFCGPVALE